jgi:hypothetical protein
MNSQNEAVVPPNGADSWKPRVFRVTYLAGSIVATIGWLVALSWAGLSVLRLFV